MDNFLPEEKVPTLITVILKKEIAPEIIQLLETRTSEKILADHSNQTSSSRQLIELLTELDLLLEPLHPNINDEILRNYFFIAVSDDTDSERILGKILEMDAVDAAYIKGLEATPQ